MYTRVRVCVCAVIFFKYMGILYLLFVFKKFNKKYGGKDTSDFEL